MTTDQTNHPSHAPRVPLWRQIAHAIPGILVLALLGGIGFVGHRSGWRAPGFSELLHGAAPPASEDWCALHNVPDSRCIACHPELAGESMADWCKEHGVPESKCTICHPEILKTGIAADWCKEHGLPESGCTLCHPEIAQRTGSALPEPELRADASNAPNAVATAVRDPATCQTHALRVQFASQAAVVKAGIELGAVIERPMALSVEALAQVEFDRRHHERVAARAEGIALTVAVALGERVVAGQLLALVECPELGKAKAELLSAHAAVAATRRTLERVVTATSAGFRTEAERLAAEQVAREAEIRRFAAVQALASFGLGEVGAEPTEETLRTLGLPAEIASSTRSANLLPVRAPQDGVIVALEVLAGAVVDRNQVLFEVAELRQMSIVAELTPSDAQRVSIGQEFLFAPDDARSVRVKGVVAWIAPSVDPHTRTVSVRADVANDAENLRAGSFGRARIVVRQSEKAIAVPNAAIQWEGCCHIVFVRLADDIFQTRKVQLGARDPAYSEVIGGLLPGEVVVTTGSHVLKSEILKSNLGAGCCAED